ncbi:hypothetical protein EGR_10587 [Echinococcus granulosus]|uniref:Uncharacterized protein n=1 Tax=Echinococcus granulosus TaxID=6210 RepID=W6U0B3_ECHGR|nr:hypothetical protein EGR_10587 [Echinococcus granulosus]EUB54545.1 hypothetical protein EGR_10587 [Echinococcus granulosus]
MLDSYRIVLQLGFSLTRVVHKRGTSGQIAQVIQIVKVVPVIAADANVDPMFGDGKPRVNTSAPNVASYFKEPGTADAYLIGQTVEANSDSLCSECVAYDTGQTMQGYLV